MLLLASHVADYLHIGDVEVESKGKTTAVRDLHHQIKQIENNY